MTDRMSELTRQYAASVKARVPIPEPKPLNLDHIREHFDPDNPAMARDAVRSLADEVVRLRATVAMHEDCILAGAKLLFGDEGWGPGPEGAGRSHLAYLSDGYYEAAAEIRERTVRRG